MFVYTEHFWKNLKKIDGFIQGKDSLQMVLQFAFWNTLWSSFPVDKLWLTAVFLQYIWSVERLMVEEWG